MLLRFQSIAPGDDFEFTSDRVLDRDYGVHLEDKRREHGANLVDRYRIIALHQHMTSPLTHAHDEELDLEIGWCFPLSEHFQDSLLRVLILDWRTLRTLKPADYVFHFYLLFWNRCDR
jgi:hypothetical protein